MTSTLPELGERLPDVRTSVPGPRSRALAARLARVESRDVTYVGEGLPVFWEAATGSNVRDVDGNVYVDLCGAFGVALAGHRPPRVMEAVRAQQDRLVHGMGDVHPPAAKVGLLERLVALGPWRSGRAVLASSGSESVEIALKTAALYTGKPGIVAFEGAYHGLTAGALATTHRDHFRAPFLARTYKGVSFAPFPDRRDGRQAGVVASLEALEQALEASSSGAHAVGAVIVEPVQGRAGVRVPPDGFLASVSGLARRHGAVLIADEVFTGIGRCGAPLASTALGLEPDLVCLGKTLGGGYPVSACLGEASVMDAWPPSSGEAVHTSTFLGHPVGCAAASAMLDTLDAEDLSARARSLGERVVSVLGDRLADVPHVGEVRGMGLLVGIELVRDRDTLEPLAGGGARVARAALSEGVVVLPAGEHGHVVELAPPATISGTVLDQALDVVCGAVVECGP